MPCQCAHGGNKIAGPAGIWALKTVRGGPRPSRGCIATVVITLWRLRNVGGKAIKTSARKAMFVYTGTGRP